MKILMISDYDAPIGGIEQYIRDAAQLLSTDDYMVTLVWLSLSSRLLHRVRPFLLPVTAFNLYFALKLVYQIIIIKPDLIRRHSVSRYIGWFPIWVVWLFRVPTWMMYHDLGYFHPYPSLLTEVSQIHRVWSLRLWLQAWHEVGQVWIINNIFMTLKFWGISLLRWALVHTASIHLVPSSYMVSILQQRWIETKKIQVLGHFWRIW
jgi:hypothetical protein